MAKKKSIEDYFNYTQPDIDVPEWFKPTAKTKADSLPQTPMMSLLSAVIGPEEYEKEMGRQAARKKSWDQFEKEEFQRSGSKPIGLTTGTPAVDYYNNNPKPAPTYPLSRVIDHDAVDTGPAQYVTMESAPVPVWSAPQPPVPDMYQQAVDLDGREPAATPVQYERSAPMNANEDVLSRISAINAANGFGGGTPSINSYRAPDQVVNGMPFAQPQVTQGYPTTTIASFDPAFVDATTPIIAGHPAGDPTSPAFIPVPSNILKDTVGNSVMSGGNTIGLPVQNAPRGATGGGKGGK
jgi:hypothetical protein